MFSEPTVDLFADRRQDRCRTPWDTDRSLAKGCGVNPGHKA